MLPFLGIQSGSQTWKCCGQSKIVTITKYSKQTLASEFSKEIVARSPWEQEARHPQAGWQPQLHHHEEEDDDHDDHIEVLERVLELSGGVVCCGVGCLHNKDCSGEQDEEACSKNGVDDAWRRGFAYNWLLVENSY